MSSDKTQVKSRGNKISVKQWKIVDMDSLNKNFRIIWFVIGGWLSSYNKKLMKFTGKK